MSDVLGPSFCWGTATFERITDELSLRIRSVLRCCRPILKGEQLPETAEKLMRSRYTAFTRVDIPYIKKTLAPESRKGFDAEEMKQSAQNVEWKKLTIVSTEKGGPDDDEGVVEFTALYRVGADEIEHHEVSQFRKDKNGQWLFVDGDAHTHKAGEPHGHAHEKQETVKRESPKVGRNDPCSCGSGKKFKKCCGVAA